MITKIIQQHQTNTSHAKRIQYIYTSILPLDLSRFLNAVLLLFSHTMMPHTRTLSTYFDLLDESNKKRNTLKHGSKHSNSPRLLIRPPFRLSLHCDVKIHYNVKQYMSVKNSSVSSTNGKIYHVFFNMQTMCIAYICYIYTE